MFRLELHFGCYPGFAASKAASFIPTLQTSTLYIFPLFLTIPRLVDFRVRLQRYINVDSHIKVTGLLVGNFEKKKKSEATCSLNFSPLLCRLLHLYPERTILGGVAWPFKSKVSKTRYKTKEIFKCQFHFLTDNLFLFISCLIRVYFAAMLMVRCDHPINPHWKQEVEWTKRTLKHFDNPLFDL